MLKDSTPPLRKDAAINRERLLAAATELFAEQGLDVTLNDIAHHAGVGVGTAYRRFANKEEIIDALFEQRLQAVADIAQEALDDLDVWNGLITYLDRTLYMRLGNRGLDQMMNNPGLGDERASEARDRIAPIITKLVKKAQKQGVIRQDLDQSDLIFIQQALSAIGETTRELSPQLYRRYLAIFLDGIKSDRANLTALPVRALTASETHLAMTRRRRGVPTSHR